ISLPSVLIKMLASGRVVGYVKVPVQEVFFSENEALCGNWCGRMRALPMKWPTLADRNNRSEDVSRVGEHENKLH
ncbi:FerB domain protein, partial [Cooperia oncophora]